MTQAYAPINLEALKHAFAHYHDARPFNHAVVDNFIAADVLQNLIAEFLPYDSPKWFYYKNAIEDKKALNDWNAFGPHTYRFLSYLNSPDFVEKLSQLIGVQLYADNGLHGGGWHSHGRGGNLNPHMDYSIHPKLGLQRRVNIIIYVSPQMQETHGGHLGLWEHDPQTGRPGKLVAEVAPQCNRALVFDTTQNSWHGISRPLDQPEGVFRNSFAVYYLCDPQENADPRGRALFAPREEQKNDDAIEELIRLRSGVTTSAKVYRQD
jgi:Rps23 Pro-64 3,4-dihydroxylase Tpa1-like proline 4-hydroxylase